MSKFTFSIALLIAVVVSADAAGHMNATVTMMETSASFEVSIFATTPAPTVTPTDFDVQGSLVLEGMTKDDMTEEAKAELKTQIAILFDKDESDVTIDEIIDVVERRRHLLTTGVQVDYTVSGFATQAAADAGLKAAEAGTAELVTALQASPLFDGLTGISIPEEEKSSSSLSSTSWTAVALCLVAATAVAQASA
jgi:hypothetical protein